MKTDTIRSNESAPITEKDFRCRMMTSLLAILTCLAVMASSAFALFHTEVASKANTIQGASYTVRVSRATPYTTPLALHDAHTFYITAEGTASTGYCVVRITDSNGVAEEYLTGSIARGDTMELVVYAAAGASITITPVWGTPPVSVDSLRNDSFEIVHSHTPYAVYIKEENAQLDAIAAHYGVDQTDILAFNGISSLDELPVGKELRIPRITDPLFEPYHVPVETESTEPETTKEPETTAQDPETTKESDSTEADSKQ